MKNRMAGRWRAAAVVLLFGAFSAGAAGTPSYSNQLLQLASSNIFDRLSAARALGGNPEAAGALIQAAKDPEEVVRAAAITGLRSNASPEAVQAVTEALADDALSVREIAVLAVGEVRATNAIPALIQALRYDDVRVRRNVADVLSQFQDERVQRAFIDALCAHPDSYVRRLAVQYVAPSGNPQALDALILSLNDEDMPVRVAAAEAMGHFRDPRVVGPLIRAFPDKRTREIAVRLLKALPPEMVRPALFAAATNDNVFIRATAVEMLGQAPDEPAFQILLAAMLDPQGHVRSPAIEAVVRFKDPRGADRLMACLSHTNGMARKEAQAALTRWYGRDYGPDESAWRRKTRPPGLFPRSFPIGQNPKVAFLKLAALMALVWLPFFQQKPFLCAAIYGAVYLLLCPLLGLPLMALWLPALAAIGLSALYFWLLFHFAGDSAIWWPVFLAGCALAAI